MRLSEAEVRKWVKLYSDEIMHFNEEDIEYVVRMGQYLDVILLPDNAGLVGYITYKDFDCKKKMNVVILYCRPEKRGLYIGYMFRKIEEVAKQEGVTDIILGASASGYKEEKFNKMLNRFGYSSCASYIKRI